MLQSDVSNLLDRSSKQILNLLHKRRDFLLHLRVLDLLRDGLRQRQRFLYLQQQLLVLRVRLPLLPELLLEVEQIGGALLELVCQDGLRGGWGGFGVQLLVDGDDRFAAVYLPAAEGVGAAGLPLLALLVVLQLFDFFGPQVLADQEVEFEAVAVDLVDPLQCPLGLVQSEQHLLDFVVAQLPDFGAGDGEVPLRFELPEGGVDPQDVVGGVEVEAVHHCPCLHRLRRETIVFIEQPGPGLMSAHIRVTSGRFHMSLAVLLHSLRLPLQHHPVPPPLLPQHLAQIVVEHLSEVVSHSQHVHSLEALLLHNLADVRLLVEHPEVHLALAVVAEVAAGPAGPDFLEVGGGHLEAEEGGGDQFGGGVVAVELEVQLVDALQVALGVEAEKADAGFVAQEKGASDGVQGHGEGRPHQGSSIDAAQDGQFVVVPQSEETMRREQKEPMHGGIEFKSNKIGLLEVDLLHSLVEIAAYRIIGNDLGVTAALDHRHHHLRLLVVVHELQLQLRLRSREYAQLVGLLPVLHLELHHSAAGGRQVDPAAALQGEADELVLGGGGVQGGDEGAGVDVEDLRLLGGDDDQEAVVGAEGGAHEAGRVGVGGEDVPGAPVGLQVDLGVRAHAVEVQQFAEEQHVRPSPQHHHPHALLLHAEVLQALELLHVPHLHHAAVVHRDQLSPPGEGPLLHQTHVAAQFSREGFGEGQRGQPEEDLAGEHPGSDVGNSPTAVRGYSPDALALLTFPPSLPTGPQLNDQFAGADLPQLDDSIQRSRHYCQRSGDFRDACQRLGVGTEDSFPGELRSFR